MRLLMLGIWFKMILFGVKMIKIFCSIAFAILCFAFGVCFENYNSAIQDIVCIGDYCEVYSQKGIIAEIDLNEGNHNVTN